MNRDKPVPALFMHIQKTAGTSIVNTARQFYGNSILSHGDCWGRNPDELKDVGFISGHIGYDYARQLMASRFSFVFFRDPIDRILSMYYFCKAQNSDEFLIYKSANENSLYEFLKAGFTDPLVKKNIWNNHVWQLAHGYAHLDERKIDNFTPEDMYELAEQHLNEFDYIGFTETFESDRNYILKALGLPCSKVVVENKTTQRPDKNDISEAAMELLKKLTYWDNKLYFRAKKRQQEINSDRLMGDRVWQQQQI